MEGLYPAGTVSEIVAEADEGYEFVNWTSSNGGVFEDANSEHTTFTMPAGDTVLTANFAKIGGGGEEPEVPDESIALLPSLTEQQTGNSGLNGLDVNVTTAYNGVESEAILVSGQTIEARYIVRNTSVKIKSVQYILALHDANGKLLDLKMYEALISPNGGNVANLSMQLPQNIDGLNLRVMVWDSSSTTPHTCMTITGE